MLADEIAVDRKREGEDGHRDDELRPVDRRLQRTNPRRPHSQIPHFRREPGMKEHAEDGGCPEKGPQVKPITALEVGVGTGALIGR